MEKQQSPFDDNQIASINALQRDPRFNAFVCRHCHKPLVAMSAGLLCPNCDQIMMDWVWDFMTNWEWDHTLNSTKFMLEKELSRKGLKNDHF